jgi:predicted Fe-Mo cluster-binding NifX family protein
MKLAIGLKGDNLTERLDIHFGRSNFFCIYDLNSKAKLFLKNTFASDPDGVGKNVVNLLKNQDVSMVVSCEYGRKVKQLLEKHKIQLVIIHNTSLTGEDVLKMIKEN